LPDYRGEEVSSKGLDWLKRNVGVVAAVSGLVVIIAVVLIYGAISRQNEETKALNEYANLPPDPAERMQRLLKLATDYEKTPVGIMAKLDYADGLKSIKNYAQAETMYSAVLTERSGKGKDIFAERAKLGLAYCAQEKQEYDKARKLYEEIVEGKGL